MNEEIKRRFPPMLETCKYTFGFRGKSIVAYVTIRKATNLARRVERIGIQERNLCRVFCSSRSERVVL